MAAALAVGFGVIGYRVWSPVDPDQLLNRAQDQYRAGRHEAADALLDRLARLREPTPLDRLLRAQVASARGRDGEAIEHLAHIPDAHPVAPLARLLTGQLEMRRGRLRAAESAFRAALELEPRAVQPRRELTYIYSIQHRRAEFDDQLDALSQLGQLTFEYVLHWSKMRNAIWDPSKDLEALERYVAGDPDDHHSRLALADALRRLGRLDEAEATVAPLPLTDPEVRAARAAIALDRGDHEAVAAMLAEGPNDHAALARLRGQLALLRHDLPAAVEHFCAAYAADPTDRANFQGLGTALSLAGDPEAAAPYLDLVRRHAELRDLVARAALRDGASDPKLPYQLGLACAALGRNAEARAWLRLAIQRDPLDAEAQRALHRLEREPTAARPGQATTIRPAVGEESGQGRREFEQRGIAVTPS